MQSRTRTSRRAFLRASLGTTAGVLTGVGFAQQQAPKPDEPPTPATEEMMREHGVLRRILLIYEEGIRRLRNRSPLPPQAIAGAAGIVRRYIEEHHERVEEEQYIFPRFVRAGRFVDLVNVLTAQHKAGSEVTNAVLELSTDSAFRNSANHPRLADALASYVRMYRPHASREDTVLFPAVREVMPAAEFRTLGETFESLERKAFGPDPLGSMLAQVSDYEQALGIANLAQFTPGGR